MIKSIVLGLVLVLSVSAHAKNEFIVGSPANALSERDARREGDKGTVLFRCTEQEENNKGKAKNASGAEKTYHVSLPSGQINKGAASRAVRDGKTVFKCEKGRFSKVTDNFEKD